MKIMRYEPNIQNALTKTEASLITEKEYNKLKKISMLVTKYVENILMSDIATCNITKKIAEITIRKIQNESITEIHKTIMIANALLPDDIKVADLLNKNGFTYNHINLIIKFRALLKRNAIYHTELDKEEKTKYNEYKITVNKIVELFTREFGVSDKTIILNRICEILVTHPDYFEKLATEHIIKR